MTQTQTTISGTARAKFFSGNGIETCNVELHPDGSIWVWDSVAGHYTPCHSLSASAAKRIARRLRAIHAS